MNAARLTKYFLAAHSQPDRNEEWIKGVFGVMLRVARRNSQFSMDTIWEQLDRAYENGSLYDDGVDHRILGPMLRHMAREGLISATGYYVKSARTGGGSRPVTVWKSHVYSKVSVAA